MSELTKIDSSHYWILTLSTFSLTATLQGLHQCAHSNMLYINDDTETSMADALYSIQCV